MKSIGKEQLIQNRVQEHYEYLQSLGYEVVCTCLQGSQNYGLDEYSEEYMSDIDTKSIVLPSLEDIIQAFPPVSTVEEMENGEHAEVKDIRIMFEMFQKMNLSYIELLYSKYIVINPKYADLIEPLFANRDLISSYNRNQFLKCISGMAMEKDKALCHPYPATAAKIEKYGYDGKQLSHCVRLYDFIQKYVRGKPLQECYEVKQPMHNILMNLKKQLDAYGDPLSLEKAAEMSKYYVAEIKRIKDAELSVNEELNPAVAALLMRIKHGILRERMREEIECSDR